MNRIKGSSFEEKWQIVESTVHRIFAHTISEFSFQQLHDAVYNLIQHRYGELVFDRLVILLNSKVDEEAKDVSSCSLDVLLQTVRKVWNNHVLSVNNTSDFLLFFNKNYCEPLRRPNVRELGVLLFGERVLVNEVRLRMQLSFIDMVSRFRNHEVCDLQLLGDISGILQAISVRSFFDEVIQTPYIHELQEFYSLRVAQLCTLSVQDFARCYLETFENERNLCIKCIGERSLPRIESALQDVWLVQHKDAFITSSQLTPLLTSRSQTELTMVVKVFMSVGESDSLFKVIREFIVSEGNTTNLDYSEAVRKLVDLIRYASTLVSAFAEHEHGQKKCLSIFRACEDAVNRNPVIPEALSLFLDSMMHAEDSEFERACEDVMLLYKYIHDKDLFESNYVAQLSKRLLSVTKVSLSEEERERAFACHLKRENGSISKIDTMLNDKKLSDQLNEEYSQQRHLTPSTDIYVSVLTSGFWPQTSTSVAPKLPIPMQDALAAFRSFYLSRHQGRRLEFSFASGTCETKFFLGGKRFELTTPTLFVPVLFVFQGESSLTANEVGEEISMSTPEVVKVLMSLSRQTQSCNGILSSNSTGTFNAATLFKVNEDFRSKTVKIRISPIPTKERSSATASKTQDDRKPKIDAALVRVMKSRRVLEHLQLVTETQNVLRPIFEATHEEIKKRIEHLIEREFIARVSERPGHYSYIA